MKKMMIWSIVFVALPVSILHGQSNTSPSEKFVTVEKDVRLEVLDWGGTGQPLIFLTGMGNDAHVYDRFAPKFTAKYHVYGITRRGFGASSHPAPTSTNYTADRLGDDVLIVIDALKLVHPVLVGHSVAGEELSSVGSRHPEKVAGLIYLDAGYGYAFYDRVHGDYFLDMLDLKDRLDALQSGMVRDRKHFMREMLMSVSQYERDLKEVTKQMVSMPDMPPPPPIITAIQFGGKKYTEIHVPILAIFACPHNLDAAFRGNPKAKAVAVAVDLTRTTEQANAFATGLPSAHVVRLPNADHYVFNSNEADIVREMNVFLAKLH